MTRALFLIFLSFSPSFGEIFVVSLTTEKERQVIVLSLSEKSKLSNDSESAWVAEGLNPVVILPKGKLIARNVGALKCLELGFGESITLKEKSRIEIKRIVSRDKLFVVGGHLQQGILFVDLKSTNVERQLKKIISPYEQVSNSKIITSGKMENFESYHRLKNGDVFVAVRHSTTGQSTLKRKKIWE
jgi:hypothetical protein